ncbi:MAG: hypothetical protein TR69_WS6001000032 [candidate division WS6 bacterium OLB20]|uniref:Uncharacterized protein n=1 Tax=candidate division WS6 bacterium OLB20 TaxID=1617426 RepID=A0A136M100_9BACT|nr:MAG: hypothetical protein TR69_WS6001000032 [candidate division WS6 bacterium OLB20]
MINGRHPDMRAGYMVRTAYTRYCDEGLVNRLQGQWVDEDDGMLTNLNEFKTNIAAGMDVLTAAENTWTGRQAYELRLRPVSILELESGRGVQVTFKPDVMLKYGRKV